ncbi:hypothetical protein EXIGLDRAFT_47453 [Exidia glandulosa HHB12029]|uniref:Uncharacterized protein n=1 Tax=Exidia glandulosa HHB12029 TaxID=1314781 RepID=A0A165P5K5_EXIGL|nr:hypothetical protein EXIGLDRAFT_47453 [Exidia glandulosa HHB12029]
MTYYTNTTSQRLRSSCTLCHLLHTAKTTSVRRPRARSTCIASRHGRRLLAYLLQFQSTDLLVDDRMAVSFTWARRMPAAWSRSASAASSRCGAHVAHERRGDALRRDRHRSGCRSRSRILATTNCAKTGALWARALRTRSLSTACCTLMTRA